MQQRKIRKIAILGSGIMGSRIACHFANIGVEVLLLDIIPREVSEKEKQKGLSLENKIVRNRIVNEALETAVKSNPAPLYSLSFKNRITTGNFEDDMPAIAECDWIMEVVVERLDIKRSVFNKVEQFRKKGTLITSNTSGIPIQLMLENRSDDFKRHFCGTHFFNPPRYLRLLEIIPSTETDPEVIEFLLQYGSVYLGKTTVLCKDTPAFIANRIGVFSIMSLFHQVQESGLTVEEVDKLTGPVLGRPKSATFRTCDVVGLDTLVHVANGVRENCPEDEKKSTFEIPEYINQMLEENKLGSKTGEGFYKKVKNEKGESEILSLDLNTLEYKSQKKASFDTLGKTKSIDDLRQRIPVLYSGTDKAGEFYKKSFLNLFEYVSYRVPGISDELYRIDDAMRAGFGWELGPFEYWEAIGIQTIVEDLEKENRKPAAWIKEMLANGISTFYKNVEGTRQFYDRASGEFKDIPGQQGRIYLSAISDESVVWKNAGCTLKDLKDGVLNLEFHTKMNTIGSEIIEGINKSIDIAEKEYKGLVISNEGQNFSAGANVGMIFMMAVEQEFDDLEFAVRAFQQTMMRIRYSSIPVVAAPHNMALGGGCELCLHADKVIAHAELYMGLVEVGIGVIPGGGGTKEFALRLSDELKDGDIRTNALRSRFLTIGQAKVSTSAHEAFELGYLRKGIDEVVINRDDQISVAKRAVLDLASRGYTRPIQRRDIMVLGNEGLGIVYAGAHSMLSGNYISEHDQLVSTKLGYVLSGGDLSEPTQVSEKYLLDLERKAFVELCMQRKTLERMQSLIQKGKIIRN